MIKICGAVGVIVMLTRIGGVTVSVTAVEVTPLAAAVIADVPAATPVARPLALMVATDVLADVQVTPLVSTAVVPLL